MTHSHTQVILLHQKQPKKSGGDACSIKGTDTNTSLSEVKVSRNHDFTKGTQ